MDIFDLNVDEFEKEIDKLLNDISEDDLLKELIENGLIVNEYEAECYYDSDTSENIWVHSKKTSRIEKIISTFYRKKNIEDLMEAA